MSRNPIHASLRAVWTFLVLAPLVLPASCRNGGAPSAPLPSDVFEPRTWTFEDAPLGAVPPGMLPASGRWAVVEGDESSGRAVAQLAESGRRTFNVLLAEGVSARDLRLRVRLRAREGRIDQGGGLVWRARDGRNYYIARWNPLEDNFRVYKVVNGRRKMLESADVRLDPTAWHTLEVEQRGDRMLCSLDGEALLEARDDTFREAGTIGLWTKADARTWFDDLELQPLPQR